MARMTASLVVHMDPNFGGVGRSVDFIKSAISHPEILFLGRLTVQRNGDLVKVWIGDLVETKLQGHG